jgi:hypothetical protein
MNNYNYFHYFITIIKAIKFVKLLNYKSTHKITSNFHPSPMSHQNSKFPYENITKI